MTQKKDDPMPPFLFFCTTRNTHDRAQVDLSDFPTLSFIARYLLLAGKIAMAYGCLSKVLIALIAFVDIIWVGFGMVIFGLWGGVLASVEIWKLKGEVWEGNWPTTKETMEILKMRHDMFLDYFKVMFVIIGTVFAGATAFKLTKHLHTPSITITPNSTQTAGNPTSTIISTVTVTTTLPVMNTQTPLNQDELFERIGKMLLEISTDMSYKTAQTIHQLQRNETCLAQPWDYSIYSGNFQFSNPS
jgi:hypothetical protein